MREFGPTDAPLADPVEIPIPHMAPEIAAYKPVVWRITEVDLELIGEWLLPKLQRNYPRLNENGIFHWFRTCMVARDMLFARTDNVVIMVRSEVSVLEPQPVMTEIFCESREGVTQKECLVLYRYVADWGMNTGAHEFMFWPPVMAAASRSRENRAIPVIGDEVLDDLKRLYDERIVVDKRLGKIVRFVRDK